MGHGIPFFFLRFLSCVTFRKHDAYTLPTANSVRQSIIHFCKLLAVAFLRSQIRQFDVHRPSF